MTALAVSSARDSFPGLTRRVGDRPGVFFDGPAGSQVPRQVIDAVAEYLAHTNANNGGSFATSRDSERVLAAASDRVATLLGASDADAVTFGANMTTMTFALSRSLATEWSAGDEVVVTRLDHDANVTPWVMAARDAGATVRTAPFRADDTTLDVDALGAMLSERTRLVAVGAAANATGTVNPIAAIAERVKAVGAELFVDAVHYAPHRLIDVEAWGCDYLACSAYKFFGPHVGILWGRTPRFAELPTYQVAPAGNALPGRWMTGTSNGEGIAGTGAAIDYIASHGTGDALRDQLASAYEAIRVHEEALTRQLIDGLAKIGDITLWGIGDTTRLDERVATFAITHASRPSSEVASILGEQGIFVWSGSFYATGVTADLGLDPEGLVRIGLLHYNTADEIDRLLGALAAL